MATLTITIDMDNSAFENNDGNGIDTVEVARIIKVYAASIDGEDGDYINRGLFDVNGNKVGQAVVE